MLIAIISTISALIIAFAAVFVGMMCCGYIEFIHTYKKPEQGQIRVACVGDSITYGCAVRGWFKNAYPVKLQNKLGSGYCVNNFGCTDRAAMSTSDKPYTKEKIYGKGLDFQPNIVVIMFGANDSKTQNWQGKEKFKAEYGKLIDSYLSLPSLPEIFICNPLPAYAVRGKYKYHMQIKVVTDEIPAAVRELAAEKGLKLIDTYSVFDGRRDLINTIDGVHPTAAGAEAFAQAVYGAIKG